NVSPEACTTRRRLAAIAPTRSAGAGATAGSAKKALHLVEDLRGDLPLRRLCEGLLPRRRHQRHLVVGCLEADVAPRDVVEDDQVDVLANQLLPCSVEAALALIGREPDQHLAGTARRAECLQDVRRRLELE